MLDPPFCYNFNLFHVCLSGKLGGIFQTEDMWTPSHVQLLMSKLTDNYDSNKVMAYELLIGLSQHTLGLMVRLDCKCSCL